MGQAVPFDMDAKVITAENFDELYRSHRGWVEYCLSTYAYTDPEWTDRKDEWVNSAFFVAWRDRHKYKSKFSLRTFLRLCARDAYIHIKTEDKAKKRGYADKDGKPSRNAKGRMIAVPSNRVSIVCTQDQVWWDGYTRSKYHPIDTIVLDDALTHLSKDHFDVIIGMIENPNVREASEALNIPFVTAWGRVHQARVHLRRALNGDVNNYGIAQGLYRPAGLSYDNRTYWKEYRRTMVQTMPLAGNKFEHAARIREANRR